MSTVCPSLSGSGMRPLNKIEWMSPLTGNACRSRFILSKIFPSIFKNFSSLSCVRKRWPSKVDVNAVQNPDVFDATSDRSDVVTKATKGTTQINTINASTICFKDLEITSVAHFLLFFANTPRVKSHVWHHR